MDDLFLNYVCVACTIQLDIPCGLKLMKCMHLFCKLNYYNSFDLAVCCIPYACILYKWQHFSWIFLNIIFMLHAMSDADPL